MTGASDAFVDPVRVASRHLVRRLGFTGASFAGTDLSPSTVHALIEIGNGEVTARDLSRSLGLEKSSVSRLVRKLVVAGEVEEAPACGDGRLRLLSLTPSGRTRVAAIHAFATEQVSSALGRLRPGEVRTVLEGLRLYAGALGSDVPASPVEIAPGYRTGIVARVTAMHASYYARTSGFGRRFEAVVAGGLAEFCGRLDAPRNAVWVALQDGEMVGSVAIDGEDMGPDVAHLRWFIVDDGARSGGIGRRLLAKALAFADEKRFAETQLWTFDGLSAARHLYEASGFALAEERAGSQWGSDMLEQRFVRPMPGGSRHRVAD